MLGEILGFTAGVAADYAAEVAKVNKLKKGKTKEQKKVIDFFFHEYVGGGCLKKGGSKMSMDAYQNLVKEKCRTLNIKEMALNKLGIDWSQVQEIRPVTLTAYGYSDDCFVRVENDQAVSNLYCITAIFFSMDQIFVYKYQFDTASNNTWEITYEFFYDDIVCITTKKEVKEKITISLKKGCFKKGEEITKDLYIDEVLEIDVPGISYEFSKNSNPNVEMSIMAAKAMIREKKARR